jgi:hypothetical protein
MSNLQLSAAAPQAEPLAPQVGLTVSEESWDSAWPEAQVLAAKHFEEVDGGVEIRRHFAPDVSKMRALNALGVLRIFVARRDGRLVGYFTWQIMPDLESRDLLIAMQGAWYAELGESRVGFRLFEFSIAALKALGVQMIFPHHRTQGRGAELGQFFKRWGAKHIQDTYSLWIGD